MGIVLTVLNFRWHLLLGTHVYSLSYEQFQISTVATVVIYHVGLSLYGRTSSTAAAVT